MAYIKISDFDSAKHKLPSQKQNNLTELQDDEVKQIIGGAYLSSSVYNYASMTMQSATVSNNTGQYLYNRLS
jgi:hypothetical protein